MIQLVIDCHAMSWQVNWAISSSISFDLPEYMSTGHRNQFSDNFNTFGARSAAFWD